MAFSGSIGVVGLGYVGLPLAVAFARHFEVVGFDIDRTRIAALRRGHDATGEVSAADLAGSRLTVSDDPAVLAVCDVVIVTVPTPVDAGNRPDFGPVLGACALLGAVVRPGTVVVFESTVYPGATEEVCRPALAAAGARGVRLGYSPERINPGDPEHPFERIVKVVAGEDAATLDLLAEVYGTVVTAGVHRAPSIKVAEAAKVIENTQRDINIALMNEISRICDLIGIRTADVLAAAGTKWNFLRFHPGLVGGHCIGVDPYYLTAKAEALGYHPQVILAGRRINDGMGSHVAQRTLKLMAAAGGWSPGSRVGVLGLTFKENVPDIRNSKVVDIVREFDAFGLEPLVHDPLADPAATAHEYGIALQPLDQFRDLDALVYAVPHRSYAALGPVGLASMVRQGGVLVDVRSALAPGQLPPGLAYWSL